MKKIITSVAALLACLALLLTLGACKIDLDNLDSTSTSELTADGKEDSFALLNEFIKGTFENGNFVVTTTQGENTRVENVVGDSSCYTEDNMTVWAFKKDGQLYGAVYDPEGVQYYVTGEGYYNNYYCPFWASVKLLEGYLTDEDGTFSCVLKSEENTTKGVTESKADITLTFAREGGKLTITAHSENGLAQSMTTTSETETGKYATTSTFAYGGAKVEIPDITGWYDATSEDYGEGDEGDEDDEGEYEEADVIREEDYEETEEAGE